MSGWVLALVVAIAALMPASALAVHGEISRFGPDGTAGSKFAHFAGSSQGGPRLAFQQATRRLYVRESGTPAIWGFNISSPPVYVPLAGFSPLAASSVVNPGVPGLAVDNSALLSAGNVYFNTTLSGPDKSFYGYSPDAGLLTGFPFTASQANGGPLAVDSAGRLWVGEFQSGTDLRIFPPTGGGPVDTLDLNLNFSRSLAFDANDDLYVANDSGGVLKLTVASDYEDPTSVDPTNFISGIVVDTKNHHLYVAHAESVREYGAAGNLVETFADIPGAEFSSVAVDPNNHYVYVADHSIDQIRVFEAGTPVPALSLSPPDPLENTSATLRGTVNPEGQALTGCHFDYVTAAAFRTTGFDDLSSGGSVQCSPGFASIPADSEDHAVSAAIASLTPNTTYRYRIAIETGGGSDNFPSSFITAGPPEVETTGSPVLTPTTAELSGRVNPEGKSTTYLFEYGPTDSYGNTTSAQPAGEGREVELVSQHVGGLTPGTTYHYRIVADNDNPDGPSVGEDMTLTPRSPLKNDQFPSPPRNDRAYEQVSIPDSGGNPIALAEAFSDDGNRAVYQISGGTPISDTGSFFSTLFAERVETAPHVGSWQSSLLVPHQLTDAGTAPDWFFAPAADLSRVIGYNVDGVSGFPVGASDVANLWRIPRGGPYDLLNSAFGKRASGFYQTSRDTGRVVTAVRDSLDPAHPVDGSSFHLYDVSSGEAQLLSFLPDGSVPACGMEIEEGGSTPSIFRFAVDTGHSGTWRGWVSADGALAFFFSRGDNCSGSIELYAREIDAGVTKSISGPAISGPECDAAFLRSTSGAAFFFTQSRLLATDREPPSCSTGASGGAKADGDVYRYDLADGSLRCLTCLVDGLDADVVMRTSIASALTDVGVSADGSAVYFASPRRLVDGAAKEGVYRVEVASGELVYVGPGSPSVGDERGSSAAVSADGSALVFKSEDAGLNPLGGTDNNGSEQYYLYDHDDRSLVCVSCPPGGSPPRAAVRGNALGAELTNFATFNGSMLSANGDVLAFDSSSPLVSADQNTAAAGQNPYRGQDVYEWRDGRPLLISDGLSDWPSKTPTDFSHVEAPSPFGVSPSGNDIFFTAAAQYTPDAPDPYSRLYDARLGGGFLFPEDPPPCPLEVCQGTPKGPPTEVLPATSAFQGLGNLGKTGKSCPKGKRRVRRDGKPRCVPRRPKHRKRSQQRANRDRRAHR